MLGFFKVMTDPLTESKTTEAAHAAAVAKEADHEALEARMTEAFAHALEKVFGLPEGEQRRFIDVSRANLICQSIVGIDARLKAMEGNLTWGVRIIIGAFIVALTALVFK